MILPALYDSLMDDRHTPRNDMANPLAKRQLSQFGPDNHFWLMVILPG